MIPEPIGWTVKHRGDVQHFVPPDEAGGSSVGNMRYRERVSPLRRFKDIVDEVLAYRCHLLDPSGVHSERFNTKEGELAGLTEIRVHKDTQPALLLIGAVFGEAHAAVLDAWTAEPERFEDYRHLARELVYQSSLGLGIRRRRFLYSPPPLWQGLGRSLTASWYPPRYPKDAACITVYPANPYQGSLETVFSLWLKDEIAKGFVVDAEPEQRHLTVPGFELGRSWSLCGIAASGVRLFRQLVLLRAAPYCYSFLLDIGEEGSSTTHGEVFQRLIESAQSLDPSNSPAPSLLLANNLLATWAD